MSRSDDDMTADKSENRIKDILSTLRERAKELNCLYSVDEILSRWDETVEEVSRKLVGVIPPGWQYPEVCRARISIYGHVSQPDGLVDTPWFQHSDILVEGEVVGDVLVLYTEERPHEDEGPFLKEERRLIDAIAERISSFLLRRKLRLAHQSWQDVAQMSSLEHADWKVVLEFIGRTDHLLLTRITRKMINHLYGVGIVEAEMLLQDFLVESPAPDDADQNRPQQKRRFAGVASVTRKTFELASRHCSKDELWSYLQSWIEEEKASFLVNTLENPSCGLAEITDAVFRFQNAQVNESRLSVAMRKSLRVALTRRVFSDQPDFVNIAKDYFDVRDFYEPLQRVIHGSQSHGKMGGKSAGMFLANQIVAQNREGVAALSDIAIPLTWHVSSDAILHFMHYNNLEDIYDRKYIEIERVRDEYAHVVQIFKNSKFPPEIVKGLSAALDEFENRPLIVRSSSLLEDRMGSAFSGKYKSLFLANQGSKKDRLDALQDAIAEVYASVFSADPIEYRAERGLLDVHEEMGIMIQEVIGRRVGPYFLPAFSGVAFSNNEFRWSPRISREDGLVRMVVGLGTRAVDRVSDDYPVLMSPGQPTLRANVTSDEIMRYSPKKADVINLETNTMGTVEIEALLRAHGNDYPIAREIVSIVDHDRMRKPTGLEPDWQTDAFAVTFEGLFADTPFVEQMRTLLTLLRTRLDSPVDIEFAHDGTRLYLLQCRAQSHGEHYQPAPIPRDIPRDKLLFTANRHISNGRIPDITHIVYVDPDRYSDIETPQEMKRVGRVVGKLNSILPKRQFILIGPGRWGSRGDIRLGVPVTYSDINNTAALLEVARRTGNYLPELSFGTHFFQDLVEADIRYIPLYPDDPDVVFNETFLRRAKNMLVEIVPDAERFEDVVRVVDVPRECGGQILRILLNADLEEGVGLLSEPATVDERGDTMESYQIEAAPEIHWRWRLRMAERIAAFIDVERLDVKALYVLGSTKNATAGPSSDIDLIVHVGNDVEAREALALWLDGWSRSLAEINYLRTGYRSDGLLDVHYVTDVDIAQRTSFAAKIGAVTDAARPLPMGEDAIRREP